MGKHCVVIGAGTAEFAALIGFGEERPTDYTDFFLVWQLRLPPCRLKLQFFQKTPVKYLIALASNPCNLSNLWAALFSVAKMKITFQMNQ